MKQNQFEGLKLEIQLKAKNGIDFIFAASLIWFGIYLIWTLDYGSYQKSIFTFIIGGILLPLAFAFSKLFKTNWKIKDNPLQPLGIWLNFAQLIYFPFLVFILIKYPDYFIMAYAVITGAHLFPYAWFYDEIGYAIFAVSISVGSMLISLNVLPDQMFYIPIFIALNLFLLGLWIFLNYKKLKNKKITSPR
ncbi:DUF7010 family protein [Psychroflexus aestuariivivens]|uniref:DUF7010 family protein n=1 Tax=Psychroflexus aestuariivivens TaxID=1795040 RepID=UPI000FD97B15|nr:hypothetical protein [Psychroflexus aestuariivivens]